MQNVMQNALSAVRAHARKTMVHAHNVANISTEGFKAQELHMQENPTGGVSSTVETRNEPGLDMVEESVGMVQAGHGYEANLAVFRASDKMLGVLIDTVA